MPMRGNRVYEFANLTVNTTTGIAAKTEEGEW